MGEILLAIGALILGGISVWTRYKQGEESIELQEEQAELQLEQDIIGLKQDITQMGGVLATTRTAIAETEAGITNVETWLNLYPQYAEKEKTEMKLAGQQQYLELMENYGMINVLAGATGRATAGTSMATKAGQARKQVAEFVGEDLTFDESGGLYGMSWSELIQNLEAEYMGKEQQLGVLETSLTQLGEAETEYEKAIAEAEAQLADWEKELGGQSDSTEILETNLEINPINSPSIIPLPGYGGYL